jgi:hypothetical protein
VNIQPCDKHATSNRNSYVPLRPRKNGRLGAEPDTAIYLEPPGGLPGGSFSADLGSLNCLTASVVSANFLLEASFAGSCFSVRLSLLSLSPRGSRSREAGDRPLNGRPYGDQGFGVRAVTMREWFVLVLDTLRLMAG